jgi:hypothetical protein
MYIEKKESHKYNTCIKLMSSESRQFRPRVTRVVLGLGGSASFSASLDFIAVVPRFTLVALGGSWGGSSSSLEGVFSLSPDSELDSSTAFVTAVVMGFFLTSAGLAREAVGAAVGLDVDVVAALRRVAVGSISASSCLTLGTVAVRVLRLTTGASSG